MLKNGSGQVIYDTYYPYGGQMNVPEDNIKYRFTEKNGTPKVFWIISTPDICASYLGRFTSVDPLRTSARAEDPQTWNRYAYNRNNPVRYLDPNGEDFWGFRDGVANGLTSSAAFNLIRIDAGTQNRDFRLDRWLVML